MKQPRRKPQFVLVTIALCQLFLVAVASYGVGIINPIPVTPFDPPGRSSVPNSHYIWEQPPLEWDALSKTPFICGWDEPSYYEQIPNATSYSYSYAVDDFRCSGPMPITSIHWWGSYQGWQGTTLPVSGLPDAWQIIFYASSSFDANRPGDEIKKFTVEPNRVSAEWVAFDRWLDTTLDSCFKYTLTLNSGEYFWSSVYDGDVFWISIAGLYKNHVSNGVWGWKTRPAMWGTSAWKISGAYSTTPQGLPLSSINILPVSGISPCRGKTSCDMTFALDTDPSWVKAEQPFTGLRDWTYYEDEVSKATGAVISGIGPKWMQPVDATSSGQNVDATADTPKSWDPEIIADDFQCMSTGPITLFTIWGAWYGPLPGGDAGNADFIISIREDLPPSGSRTYSMPGAVLWTKTFKKGQFSVLASNTDDQGYSSSAAGKSYSKFIWQGYQYTFPVDDTEAFVQTGTQDKPVIYWLSVQAQVTRVGDTTSRFGWKTSASTWGSDAVWVKGQEPYSGTWQKWSYPFAHPRSGQKTAMAFMVMTTSVGHSETVEREVADDWKSEDASPVVAMAWWGSYLGYTYQACECNQKAPPVKPAYFLLSLWSNVPDPNASNSQDFAHPGDKVMDYVAMKYDEVMVGFDSGPADGNTANGREPVYRYSVTLPTAKRFTPQAGETYWLSVMAVYGNPKAANYPWGWTNHEQTSGAPAVVGTDSTDATGKTVRTWQRLYNAARDYEDMSFILFQQGQTFNFIPR
jgi:hypothetical protein